MLKVKALAAAIGVAGMVAVGMPAVASAALTVPYGSTAESDFVSAFLGGGAAPGENLGTQPTATHPYPVILVHGTLENQHDNWVTLAPLLANNGYAVYSFDYGETGLSLGGRIDGLGDIPKSAGQLATEVASVEASTDKTQVDIVGHSQGGMMPNYYIKRLGGAGDVHDFVGLNPSNHGTTLDGIENLGKSFPAPIPSIIKTIVAGLGVSLVQQESGSSFMTALFADGDTVPGPTYTVIETTKDEVVTPYTNAFLSGADNITIQNQCPKDTVEHIFTPEDGPATQDVLNALSNTPNPSFAPSCTNFGPAL